MVQIGHTFTGTLIIRGDTLRRVRPERAEEFTAQTYSSVKAGNPLPDFEVDSKNQRSWTRWMTEWLTEARRVSKQGAHLCLFIDW